CDAQLVIRFFPGGVVESSGMARKSRAPRPAPSTKGYAEWRTQVQAEMRRRDIPTIYLRERALRNLFIANASPEEATERAQSEANKAPPWLGGKARGGSPQADHWRTTGRRAAARAGALIQCPACGRWIDMRRLEEGRESGDGTKQGSVARRRRGEHSRGP